MVGGQVKSSFTWLLLLKGFHDEKLFPRASNKRESFRTSKFHYNYHKNKLENMAADLDRAEYHKEMMGNYVARIEASSKNFWS